MRILIRCDASEAIGLGHAGRTLALGEAIGQRLGTPPTFLSRPDPLLDRFLAGRTLERLQIAGLGYAVTEVSAVLKPGDVLVSDTYDLNEAALSAIAGLSVRHVVVDDFGHFSSWPCDVVVNPNLGASIAPYGGARRVLVGARYALLRSEIRAAAAKEKPVVASGQRLLVCLGGGAWDEASDALLTELGTLSGEGVEIRATLKTASPPPGVEPVAPATLPEQLLWADAAVLSGGVVKYEAAACALPALLTATVPHQVQVAELFSETGAARYLGPLLEVDPRRVAGEALGLLANAELRRSMAEAGRGLVDGSGADRVAATLLEDP